MKHSRETLDRLKCLDAKAARLRPLAPIVQEFERAWDELAAVRKSRKGTKAAREEKAKLIAERMRANRPLVSLVLKSRQLVSRLVDQVATSEDGLYDFDQAALVDSLWTQIRVLREIVPKAERDDLAIAARAKATKISADKRKTEADKRDAEIKQGADAVKARNPSASKTDIARILAERDEIGGRESIRKRLTRLLPAKKVGKVRRTPPKR